MEECWDLFGKAKEGFCYWYAVYHFYRASNKVPKYGTKYGVDFLIYEKQGPSHFHSHQSLLICPIQNNHNHQNLKENDKKLEENDKKLKEIDEKLKEIDEKLEKNEIVCAEKGKNVVEFLNLVNLNRVSEQARKQLVICYVIHPKLFDESDFRALHKLEIVNVLIRRWIPDQNRIEVDE